MPKSRADTLIAALNQLVDALTGLERILTTPIPFSSVKVIFMVHLLKPILKNRYSFHLWTVTMIYCLAFVRTPFPPLTMNEYFTGLSSRSRSGQR